MQHIPSCIKIEKTDVETDKTGIDYVATLRGGAKVFIDAKTREPGCSKHWRHGEPELAIETWSVWKTNQNEGIAGWTYKESSNVDYILYTFPKEDCKEYFFIPFQLLRKVAKENGEKWSKTYRPLKQQNKGYFSVAMFVPASVVLNAIRDSMIGIRPD